MKKRSTQALSLLLAAALLLTLTVLPASAATSATAATIRLSATTGTVFVTNSSGRSLTMWDNMLLYNGYRVETRARSYAWISLDSTKLTKLDASGKVEVRKSGKKLELLLSSGNLYFNVTNPLEKNETLNVRTSTMLVGIRGTSGWVKVIDRQTTEFYVLEGTVQVSVTDPVTGQTKTAIIRGGEKVTAKTYPQEQEGDKCDIVRERFGAEDIDGFVLEELAQDPGLCGDIFEKSGMDPLPPVGALESVRRQLEDIREELEDVREQLEGENPSAEDAQDRLDELQQRLEDVKEQLEALGPEDGVQRDLDEAREHLEQARRALDGGSVQEALDRLDEAREDLEGTQRGQTAGAQQKGTESARDRLERNEQELQDRLDRAEEELAGQDNNVSADPVWDPEEPDPEPDPEPVPSTPGTSGTGGESPTPSEPAPSRTVELSADAAIEEIQAALDEPDVRMAVVKRSDGEPYDLLEIVVDLTVPGGKALTIGDGIDVEVSEGSALVVNGTMEVMGDLDNNGEITVDGIMYVDGGLVNIGALTVNGTMTVDGKLFNGTVGTVTVNSSNTLRVADTINNEGTINNTSTGRIVAGRINEWREGYLKNDGLIESGFTLKEGAALTVDVGEFISSEEVTITFGDSGETLVLAGGTITNSGDGFAVSGNPGNVHGEINTAIRAKFPTKLWGYNGVAQFPEGYTSTASPDSNGYYYLVPEDENSPTVMLTMPATFDELTEALARENVETVILLSGGTAVNNELTLSAALSVAAGKTLAVSAGVTVTDTGSYGISVEGTLIVEGTVNGSVSFTGNSTGAMNGEVSRISGSVSLRDSSTFTMNGGTIDGGTDAAVSIIGDNAAFTINDGEVTASANSNWTLSTPLAAVVFETWSNLHLYGGTITNDDSTGSVLAWTGWGGIDPSEEIKCTIRAKSRRMYAVPGGDSTFMGGDISGYATTPDPDGEGYYYIVSEGDLGPSVTLTMPRDASTVQYYLNLNSVEEVILRPGDGGNTLAINSGDFMVAAGKALTLEDGINVDISTGGTLTVNGAMTGSGFLTNYGALTVNNGGTLSDNYIEVDGGTFTMNAGTITGDITLKNETEFIMNGGTINGTVNLDESSSFNAYGGTIDGGDNPAILVKLNYSSSSLYYIYIGETADDTTTGSNNVTLKSNDPGSIIKFNDGVGIVRYAVADSDGRYSYQNVTADSILTTMRDGDSYQLTNVSDDIAEALNSAADGEIVTLPKDCTTKEADVLYTRGGSELNPVTLDLNGHTLNVTYVWQHLGALRICDGSSTGGGTIAINNQAFYVELYLCLDSGTIRRDDSFAFSISANAAFVMNGGEVIGGYALPVNDGARVTLNGGTINCPVSLNGAADFTMDGGTISGDVLVDGGTFTMDSGTINGGVNVKGTSNFTMNGGLIDGGENAAASVYSDASFTINGGEVTSSVSLNSYTYTGAPVSTVEFGSFGNLALNGGTITNSGTGFAFLGYFPDDSLQVTIESEIRAQEKWKFFGYEGGDSAIGSWFPTGYTSTEAPDEYGYYYLVKREELAAFSAGNNITVTLYDDGSLVFRGAGDMAAFTSPQPWFDYLDRIKTVIIGDGVTGIGAYTFYNCSSLESVTIPDSVASIGNGAFQSCTNLTDVYYSGDEEAWSSIGIGVNNDPLLSAAIHYGMEGYSLAEGTLVRSFAMALSDGSAHPFADVADAAWYSGPVQYAYEHGLMQGTGDTTFAPDSPTSRGMIVTILHRLEGFPEAAGTDFPDVPEGQWYTDAVAWASGNGIIVGYDSGNFGPDDPVTREQAAVILHRYANYMGYDTTASGDLSAFPDGDTVSSYAVDAVSWAVGTGLLLGADGHMLFPANGATRAQIATVLTRFCEDIVPVYDMTVVSAIDVMCEPSGILFLEDGSFLVTDTYNKVIWRVADGVSAVYAGGDTVSDPYDRPIGGYNDAGPEDTYFRLPWAIVPFLDGFAVTDADNDAVRLVRPEDTKTVNGVTEEELTVTELGVAFSHPTGLASDEEGNLYVSDTFEGAVRKITPEGTVTTFVDGLTDPMGLFWRDGTLYIAETGANRIVKVTDGEIVVVAGSGEDGFANGPAAQAAFSGPQGVTVGEDGTVYVSDTLNGAVRQIRGGVASTLVHRDVDDPESFIPISPVGLALNGDQLYVCDSFSRKVFVISLTSGEASPEPHPEFALQ